MRVLDWRWREEEVQHVALLLVGRDHVLTDLVLDTAGLVDDEDMRGAHTHGLYRGHSQCLLSEIKIEIVYLVSRHVCWLVSIPSKVRVGLVEILQGVEAFYLEYLGLSVNNFSLKGSQGRLRVEQERSGRKAEISLTEKINVLGCYQCLPT